MSLLNDLKDLSIDGFSESGLTLSLNDLKSVDKTGIQVSNKMKFIHEVDDLTKDYMDSLSVDNNMFCITTSGTKGNTTQLRGLVVSKGVLLDTFGEMTDPIINSISEGLTKDEYITSIKGSRKGLVDKSVSTAVSGYFEARAVKSLRDYRIMSEDCNTDYGITIPIKESINRYSYEDIGSTIKENQLITRYMVDEIVSIYGEDFNIYVRSPFMCNHRSDGGVCKKCYGAMTSKNEEVRIGDNVGTNTGMTMSEIVTQLTLKTFHTSGSFNMEYTDIKSESDIDKLEITEYHNHYLITLDGLQYMINKSNIIIHKESNIKIGDKVFSYSDATDDISSIFKKLDDIVESRSPKNKSKLITHDGILILEKIIKEIKK